MEEEPLFFSENDCVPRTLKHFIFEMKAKGVEVMELFAAEKVSLNAYSKTDRKIILELGKESYSMQWEFTQ